MEAESRDADELVDIRLQLRERQVQLLESLAEESGPCETPNDALHYVIEEFEGLAEREPWKVA